MILVTGATGCIGSNLTRALVHDGEAVAILRKPDDDCAAIDDVKGEVEHRIGDVRDPESVARAFGGVTHVYHLAGVAVPVNDLASSLHEVNVTGTQNVMRSAHRAGARVVHTSSVSAVGFPQGGTLADESFQFNAHGHAYAVSKRLGERVVKRYVQEGLHAVVVNPAACLAPGGDLRRGWAALVARLRARRLPCFTDGGLAVVTRRDVVDGHLRAMERGRAGSRYILGSANLAYRELFDLAASVLGVPSPRVRVPDGLLRVAARGAALAGRAVRDPERRPLLTPENVPLLTRRVYYDAGRAARELGTSSTELSTAIEELAHWCEQREGRR